MVQVGTAPNPQAMDAYEQLEQLISSNLLFLRFLISADAESVAESIATIFLSKKRAALLLDYCVVSELASSGMFCHSNLLLLLTPTDRRAERLRTYLSLEQL